VMHAKETRRVLRMAFTVESHVRASRQASSNATSRASKPLTRVFMAVREELQLHSVADFCPSKHCIAFFFISRNTPASHDVVHVLGLQCAVAMLEQLASSKHRRRSSRRRGARRRCLRYPRSAAALRDQDAANKHIIPEPVRLLQKVLVNFQTKDGLLKLSRPSSVLYVVRSADELWERLAKVSWWAHLLHS